MLAVAKDAARFRKNEGLTVEAKRIDDGFCKAGEGFRGASENLLRDDISSSGSFDYNRKELRENSVRMFGDALEQHVPVLSFGGSLFGAKDFFAEGG